MVAVLLVVLLVVGMMAIGQSVMEQIVKSDSGPSFPALARVTERTHVRGS